MAQGHPWRARLRHQRLRSVGPSDTTLESDTVRRVRQLLADLRAESEGEAGRLRAEALLSGWDAISVGADDAGDGQAEVVVSELGVGSKEEPGMDDYRDSSQEALGEAVKLANAAYYRAFNARDAAAMAELWADEDAPCECVHPGKPRVRGRSSVMASWERVLGAESCPSVSFSDVKVLFASKQGAAVICTEENDKGGVLEVTNTFVRGDDGTWRCVGHHAGPIEGGSGGYLLALLGQGLRSLAMPWDKESSSVEPVGVPVLVRQCAKAPKRVPTRSEAGADEPRELAARRATEELLAAWEARSSAGGELLRARAVRLRWEALAMELDGRAAPEGEAVASDSGGDNGDDQAREELKAVASAAQAANAAFYRAFNSRDVVAMGRLLAPDGTPCECTHPGKPRIQGREAVLSSWELVLSGLNVPTLDAVNLRVLVATPQGAVVTCTEEYDTGGFLEATNTFARGFGGALYMVGHHAG